MNTASQPEVALATVRRIVAAGGAEEGALLPVLHAIQDAIGCIPPAAVPLIASGLNLSRAEVHGVITYYPHFRQMPPGRHLLRLCRAEACQAAGADALIAHARQHLDCDLHATTADGRFTLEPVYCLGQCACGPALLVDDQEIHGRVTPAVFDAIVAAKGEAP